METPGCYGSVSADRGPVAKQKHDSGRKKLDQRRSKEKKESGGRGGGGASGKGSSKGKR
jgi:hypothetical protein